MYLGLRMENPFVTHLGVTETNRASAEPGRAVEIPKGDNWRTFINDGV